MLSSQRNSLALFFSFFFSVVLSSSSLAQTGTLKGVVTDSITQETLIGVGIKLVELPNKSTTTSIDGDFTITGIPAGKYHLVRMYIGYKTDTNIVSIAAGQTTEFNKGFREDVAEMKEVVIVIHKPTNTESAVIQEVKEAEQVVSAVSAEQISKSQDRDAGAVMRRIPGVTLIDNRFVMVRGLNQRYNNVMINGVIAPSTEPDSRAFSFDIIPSNMLDRMLVFKSGSAEIPGDMAGAVVKIYTKSTVDKNFISIGLSTSYRAGTTFEKINTYDGGSTDFLGFDDGARKLPIGFSEKNLRSLSLSNKEYYSKSLDDNWSMRSSTATPDTRFNFDIGRKFEIGRVKISNISSIGYTYNTLKYKASRNRFDAFDEQSQTAPASEKNVDIFTNQGARLGFIHNWKFELSPNSRIEFKNLFNQTGIKETLVYSGQDYSSNGNISYGNVLGYRSKGIYSGQLLGDHEFNNDRTSINWVIGYNNLRSAEPDSRRARAIYDPDKGMYRVNTQATATLTDGARFFSQLSEFSVANSAGIEHLIPTKKDSTLSVKLRAGYYTEYKAREFNARWMSYVPSNLSNFDVNLHDSFDKVYSNSNIDKTNGFILSEGTNFSDTYLADNMLIAGYTGAVIPFSKKFNLTAGIRVENNSLILSSRDASNKPVEVDLNTTSVLPSTNFSYNFSDKQLVRLAYSQTVDRPVFREIAPFSYYSFYAPRADWQGNPDLKIANIHNGDIRWELYPSASEAISVGVFYKYFINPIEQAMEPAANPLFKPRNANSAYSTGVELEIRKSLSFISPIKLFDRLGILINASLIRSKVDVSNIQFQSTSNRPLQGQSPYIFNGGLFYNDKEHSLNVSLLYNVYGKRIFLVGNQLYNTIYELPRNLLDLTVTKSISEKMDLRFGISDILNAKFRLFEDSNQDGKIETKKDGEIQSYRLGSYWTVGVVLKLQ